MHENEEGVPSYVEKCSCEEEPFQVLKIFTLNYYQHCHSMNLL